MRRPPALPLPSWRRCSLPASSSRSGCIADVAAFAFDIWYRPAPPQRTEPAQPTAGGPGLGRQQRCAPQLGVVAEAALGAVEVSALLGALHASGAWQ